MKSIIQEGDTSVYFKTQISKIKIYLLSIPMTCHTKRRYQYLIHYSQEAEMVTSSAKGVWWSYTSGHFQTLTIEESFGLIHVTGLRFLVFIILQLVEIAVPQNSDALNYTKYLLNVSGAF